METIKSFWLSLSQMQQTIIIVVVALILLAVLGSFIFMGTDYSGFGDWLKSWGQ